MKIVVVECLAQSNNPTRGSCLVIAANSHGSLAYTSVCVSLVGSIPRSSQKMLPLEASHFH